VLIGCGASSSSKPTALSTTTGTTVATSKSQSTNSMDRSSEITVAARVVLQQYLDLSLARRHETAYSLLTDKDHKARAWITYVNAERESDRLRDQVRALGNPSVKITWLKQGADMTTAIVKLSTGIGTSKIRFVLHKDVAGWRVDYENSWQPVTE
jgi:hypothetical protein